MAEETRQAPDWVDGGFIETALREGLKLPELTIETYDIAPAVAVGENYGSIMFRIKLDYYPEPGADIKQLSVVCKTPPKGQLEQLSKQTFQFQKEAYMFGKLMPIMLEALREVIPDQAPLCAEGLYFANEPDEVAILEDLRETGFHLLDRHLGLDLQSSWFVLRSLAKFHASSLVLKEKHPELLTEMSYNFWKDDSTGGMQALLESGLDALIAEAESWEDFPADWLERLKGLQDNPFDREKESQAFDEESLNVLCHGDCWMSNMMFQTEHDKVVGFRFLDLQLSSWNSWALDVNYFIFTCPRVDIRIQKLEFFLHTYYSHFMETVQLLGIELPKEFSFEDFQEEIKRRSFHAFYGAIVIYPVTIKDNSDIAADGDDLLFDAAQTKRMMYRNQTFKDMFYVMMPYFIDIGVL